jgi:flagellar hook assembly protein FlgD
MVRLTISDPAGRIIRYLDTGMKSQGDYSVVWDGRGEEGYEASPGFYMISIETASGMLQTLRLIKQ